MLRAVTALLQEKNINDPVPLLDHADLTVDTVQENHRTIHDVEFITHLTESANFTSFIVGNQNDASRLYTFSTSSEGTTQ